jgi:drug efflux transport system permease protein
VILRSVFLQGTPFHLLVNQFWPMAIIGLLNLTVAGWMFRARMY